jgi:hypothetical protein
MSPCFTAFRETLTARATSLARMQPRVCNAYLFWKSCSWASTFHCTNLPRVLENA